MRAGTTDDNADFSAYLAFLARVNAEPGLRGGYLPIDVEGRSRVQVVDEDGQPMPGIELRFVDQGTDRVVWRGTTYGDGRVPFYPRLVRGEGAPPWLVEVLVGERMVRAMTFGDRDLVVRVPVRARRAAAVPIDVAFVLDTTGSMRDEIAAIQATLLDLTRSLRGLGRDVDLRYGAVLYRDVGDAYVTRHHPFAADLESFERVLGGVEVGGGGDGPESLNQALAVAVDELQWRAAAARVAFVVGDAPPHVDYEGDVPYDKSLRAAVARGIRIHAVAASGLRDEGTVVFRQIAQFTRGEFVFVEYGKDVQASARAHRVAGAVAGNDLGEILFARIRDEALRWGRSEGPATVAR